MFVPDELEVLGGVFTKSAFYVINQNVKLVGHKHYCFDGKTLRGSKSNVDQKPSARIFELFESIGEIILAHIPLDSNKDHELQAFEEFLQSLELCGIIVTADALHCQKKTLN